MACVASLEGAVMDLLDRANVFGFGNAKSKSRQKEQTKNKKSEKKSQIPPSRNIGEKEYDESLQEEIIDIDGAL